MDGLKSVNPVAEGLEEAGQDFEDFRSKHSKIWKALARITKPILVLGSVAQAAVSFTPFAPASLVPGAAMHIVESAAQIFHTYDQTAELFENISDALERFEVYDRADPKAELQKRITRIFCKTIEIIGES